MARVGPRPDDDQLQLLTEWDDAFAPPRRGRAGVLSVLVHVTLISVILLLPSDLLVPPEPPPPERRVVVTPLVEPLTEFTQKDPTKGKVSHEIDMASLQPRPSIRAPHGPPPAPRGTPKPAALPPMETAPPKPAASALPEPPKIEATQREAPKVDLPPGPSQAAPPQIQTVEKPKLAFENVGNPPPPVPPGQSRVAVPSGSVNDAIHQSIRSGTMGGGAYVGDAGALPGIGESINQPPGPGVPGSALMLKSDPMGVDFQPYLKQILMAIKTNWLAVYPESARMGRRGKVTLAFIVAKDGTVAKVATSTQSGTQALDRAAIAAISASNPFPPLPPDFKGERIVLEVNFVYNMPRR